LNINSIPKKPILVFGYGNLSRGDDAVGPLLLAYLEQHANLSNVELLNDFQLQIEHALDLQDRDWVMFVDAAVNIDDAFTFKKLQPCRDNSYTSHAMSPAALLQVYADIARQTLPPCFLLSIKAESFELGEDLSASCANNLHQACEFALRLLALHTTEVFAAVESVPVNIS
jgi:hydrogenase maturation protease